MSLVLMAPSQESGDLAKRLCRELKRQLQTASAVPGFWEGLDQAETAQPAAVQPILDWLDAETYSGDLDLHDECPRARSELMLTALRHGNWPRACATLARYVPAAAQGFVSALILAHERAFHPGRSRRSAAVAGRVRGTRRRKLKTPKRRRKKVRARRSARKK